jgi:hypothetical protein
MVSSDIYTVQRRKFENTKHVCLLTFLLSMFIFTPTTQVNVKSHKCVNCHYTSLSGCENTTTPNNGIIQALEYYYHWYCGTNTLLIGTQQTNPIEKGNHSIFTNKIYMLNANSTTSQMVTNS